MNKTNINNLLSLYNQNKEIKKNIKFFSYNSNIFMNALIKYENHVKNNIKCYCLDNIKIINIIVIWIYDKNNNIINNINNVYDKKERSTIKIDKYVLKENKYFELEIN